MVVSASDGDPEPSLWASSSKNHLATEAGPAACLGVAGAADCLRVPRFSVAAIRRRLRRQERTHPDTAGLRSCPMRGSAMIDPAVPDGGVKWDSRPASDPEFLAAVVATGPGGTRLRVATAALPRQAKIEDALDEEVTAARLACDSRVKTADVMDACADDFRTRCGGPVGDPSGQT